MHCLIVPGADSILTQNSRLTFRVTRHFSALLNFSSLRFSESQCRGSRKIFLSTPQKSNIPRESSDIMALIKDRFACVSPVTRVMNFRGRYVSKGGQVFFLVLFIDFVAGKNTFAYIKTFSNDFFLYSRAVNPRLCQFGLKVLSTI